MFNNYKYYVNGRKVIAVSTFAGKTVRGVAICSNKDAFNLEKGKKLAAARCNEKVARKRMRRAAELVKEASAGYTTAFERMSKMNKYLEDAYLAYNEAAQEVDMLEENY